MCTCLCNQVLFLFFTYELVHEKTGLSSGFLTRSETNRAVQPQKVARGLKFGILIEEGLYYLSSENKAQPSVEENGL